MLGPERERIISASSPYLERIRAVTGETVGLYLPVSGLWVCVVELESAHDIRFSVGVGFVDRTTGTAVLGTETVVVDTNTGLLSIPVLDHSGTVRAAVTVCGPAFRWPRERMTANRSRVCADVRHLAAVLDGVDNGAIGRPPPGVAA